jgi:glycosyltransferase involved in cell wall biosynthesis
MGLRVLFSTPAYDPAQSFGGSIHAFRELAEGLVERGHTVEVFTTSLTALDKRGAFRTTTVADDGATVRYLATPLRFRWIGFTPSLPLHLLNARRPDVVHVFGYRDLLGTAIATWSRLYRIPYVFEGLGMVEPKVRKLKLKTILDTTALRGVLGGAALLVAASEWERDEYVRAGVAPRQIAIRTFGFPEVVPRPAAGAIRRQIGLDEATSLVLSVGRIARGKGLDLLVRAVATLPGVHAALVGPDGGHGMAAELETLRRNLGVEDRVHILGAVDHAALSAFYADADVFVLASEHESFGLVAAEAAALGMPVVVSDRCGVAELLRDGAGVVIGYDEGELRSALERLLADRELRRQLGEHARTAAAACSWPHVVERQEELYKRVLARA